MSDSLALQKKLYHKRKPIFNVFCFISDHKAEDRFPYLTVFPAAVKKR
jgi:hypothetical protein